MKRFVPLGFVLLVGLTTGGEAQYTGPLSPGASSSAVEAEFIGTVTSLTKKDLGIQADGGNVLSFSILHKTRFLKGGKTVKWSDMHVGDTVTIQAGEDPDGHPAAIVVTFGRPPAKKDAQPST